MKIFKIIFHFEKNIFFFNFFCAFQDMSELAIGEFLYLSDQNQRRNRKKECIFVNFPISVPPNFKNLLCSAPTAIRMAAIESRADWWLLFEQKYPIEPKPTCANFFGIWKGVGSIVDVVRSDLSGGVQDESAPNVNDVKKADNLRRDHRSID